MDTPVITIPKDEFEKIINNIKQGINDPTNPAKIALSKIWLQILKEYNTNE